MPQKILSDIVVLILILENMEYGHQISLKNLAIRQNGFHGLFRYRRG